MKDGPSRTSIKRLALLRYYFDLGVMRGVRRFKSPARYQMAGTCEGCGLCCETPMIQVHPLLFRLRSYRRLFLGWHSRINGFHLLREDKPAKVFVFTCSHYDKETKQCDSYHSRPGMCRDYPRNLFDRPFPELLPECTYRVVDTNAHRMKAALDKLELTPEQRAELDRKLHLQDPASDSK